MWGVSDRFLAAIRGAHQMVVQVDVLDQGAVVAGDIAVAAGTITRDRMAAQYGRLTAQIADPELAPLVAGDQLGPAGFELAVSRGIRFPVGTTELVPLGIFGIQNAAVDDATMATQIEAVDRSQRVSDAKLESDVQYSAGTDLMDIQIDLYRDVFPEGDYTATTSDTDVSGLITYEAQSDRWQIIQDIARDCGCEAFFDGIGRLVLREEPLLTETSPVWTVEEGDGGVLISVDLAWSRRPSYNRAIVTGTNTEFDVTYRGTATDNSSHSPSYYSGRFGPKPIFVFSSHVSSTAQAQRAARAILAAKQGVARSVDFSAVPNPALEPGDVVTIRREQIGLDDLAVVVDSITLGLGPQDPMTCSVRARQDEDIEV